MAKSKLAPTVSLTFLQDLVRHYLEVCDRIDALRSEHERLDAQLRIALEVSRTRRPAPRPAPRGWLSPTW